MGLGCHQRRWERNQPLPNPPHHNHPQRQTSAAEGSTVRVEKIDLRATVEPPPTLVRAPSPRIRPGVHVRAAVGQLASPARHSPRTLHTSIDSNPSHIDPCRSPTPNTRPQRAILRAKTPCTSLQNTSSTAYTPGKPWTFAPDAPALYSTMAERKICGGPGGRQGGSAEPEPDAHLSTRDPQHAGDFSQGFYTTYKSS